MQVRFWGVRGSVASSGPKVARIGGNTACVEVTSQGQRLIFDSGTGIRALGERMLQEARAPKAALFFSHLHWDHIQGFPFFTPAYAPGAELSLYGPGQGGAERLQEVLGRQMQPPAFPVTLAAMQGGLRFHTALAGVPLTHGPFVVTPFALPHPQGCLGYRVDVDGASFAYATDVELSLEGLPVSVAQALEGVDALCLDAQYTPEEYAGLHGPCRKGWGHSTMVEAARIAQAVGAKRLFLFHHDPAHDDERVEEMAEEARAHFTAAEPAREGKSILLGRHGTTVCAQG